MRRSLVESVWVLAGAVLILALSACGEATPPTTVHEDPDLSTVPPSASTVTSTEFVAPESTSPPAFGPSLLLPLPDGYGVVCAEVATSDGFWHATILGPFADDEGPEFDAVVAIYEGFLRDSGFQVSVVEVIEDRLGWIELVGESQDALVSLRIWNTMSENRIAASWAPRSAGHEEASEYNDKTSSSCI